MRIGHCQYETKCGDFDGNLAKVVKGLERAERDRVEIVCFPECFLTGYPDTEELARKDAFAANSEQVLRVLDRTNRFDATFIVPTGPLAGRTVTPDASQAQEMLYLYPGAHPRVSTAVRLSATFPFISPICRPLALPVPAWEEDDAYHCADGGYVEPSRILALKGARIIFSPHFNYIGKDHLIQHFQHVRADHVARAVENGVYFVRGNNVVHGKDPAITHYDGVGYGDSYIVDPYGEFVVRSRRHHEDFIFADIDPAVTDTAWKMGRSLYSIRELHQQLLEAAGLRK